MGYSDLYLACNAQQSLNLTEKTFRWVLQTHLLGFWGNSRLWTPLVLTLSDPEWFFLKCHHFSPTYSFDVILFLLERFLATLSLQFGFFMWILYHTKFSPLFWFIIDIFSWVFWGQGAPGSPGLGQKGQKIFFSKLHNIGSRKIYGYN